LIFVPLAAGASQKRDLRRKNGIVASRRFGPLAAAASGKKKRNSPGVDRDPVARGGSISSPSPPPAQLAQAELSKKQ